MLTKQLVFSFEASLLTLITIYTLNLHSNIFFFLLITNEAYSPNLTETLRFIHQVLAGNHITQ